MHLHGIQSISFHLFAVASYLQQRWVVSDILWLFKVAKETRIFLKMSNYLFKICVLSIHWCKHFPADDFPGTSALKSTFPSRLISHTGQKHHHATLPSPFSSPVWWWVMIQSWELKAPSSSEGLLLPQLPMAHHFISCLLSLRLSLTHP